MRRLTAVSILIALAATACGKGGSNQGLARLDQTGFISQVAAKSVAQRTAKLEMTESITPPSGSGGMPVSLVAEGEIDMAKKVMEMKMNFPAGLGLSGAIEMVVSGTTIYMHIPEALLKTAGLSKPWLGMKLDKQLIGSVLGGANFTDPGSVLQALQAVASSVTKVGKVTVRGVNTTKYDVALDLTKIASKVPALWRQAVSQLNFDHMAVYIGDDNLVRREEFSATSQGASITTQIDLFDYGTPIHVSAPPASQVEFKSLQDLMNMK